VGQGTKEACRRIRRVYGRTGSSWGVLPQPPDIAAIISATNPVGTFSRRCPGQGLLDLLDTTLAGRPTFTIEVPDIGDRISVFAQWTSCPIASIA